MPVMNGIRCNACKYHFTQPRDDAADSCPIIADDRRSFPDDVKKCRDAGMNSFVIEADKNPMCSTSTLGARTDAR